MGCLAHNQCIGAAQCSIYYMKYIARWHFMCMHWPFQSQAHILGCLNIGGGWARGGGGGVVVVVGCREEGVFLQVYRLFSNISSKHCNDAILRKVLLCLPVILQVSQNNTTHLVLVLPNHLNESSMSGRTASARHSHC